MENNHSINSTDIINNLKNDPDALKTLIAMIETGTISVEHVASFAAMLPETDLQIEYSLVSSFNAIHQQTHCWMTLKDVIRHIRASGEVHSSVTDAAIEFFMDNSKYIDHRVEFGQKHYRMKSFDFEFDAVDILWGPLVDLLGKQEANRLFLIAQQG